MAAQIRTATISQSRIGQLPPSAGGSAAVFVDAWANAGTMSLDQRACALFAAESPHAAAKTASRLASRANWRKCPRPLVVFNIATAPPRGSADRDIGGS